MSKPTFTDLPLEILLLIIPYLSPRELLNLCSCCHTLQDSEELRLAPHYWSSVTRNTFRLPKRTALSADGRRWMSLFRRIVTQTRVYTWGQGTNRRTRGDSSEGLPESPGWPVPINLEGKNMGIIADLQCGGWSMTVLNSSGALFTFGDINPSHVILRGGHRYLQASALQASAGLFRLLLYPEGYLSPKEEYNSSTAIAQFSAGRGHILGLSDSGRIWTWEDTAIPGRHVKFLSIDLVEDQSQKLHRSNGYVTKVVAGWACSSAYINGVGIVVWEPSDIAEERASADLSEADGMMVLEIWTVPLSQYRRNHQTSKAQEDAPPQYLAKHVGEVTNYVVLEHFIIFITDLGKVFMSKIQNRDAIQALESIEIQLPAHSIGVASADLPNHVIDIYGSFRNYGFIKRNGEVLIGGDGFLEEYWSSKTQSSADRVFAEGVEQWTGTPFVKHPCLQGSGVIALTFGDYHYHALHSNGTISSYGTEPNLCGALGLGGWGEQIIRGARNDEGRASTSLLQDCCKTSGRRVHFEKEKRIWIDQLRSNRADCKEASERIATMDTQRDVQLHVSEWFEEKLSNWEKGPSILGHHDIKNRTTDSIKDVTNEIDELPAYFALSVSAAGWRSGALILVNEAKKKQTRKKYIVKSKRQRHEVSEEKDQEPQQAQDVNESSNTVRPISDDLSAPGRTTSSDEPSTDHRHIDLAEGEEWIWADDTFPRLKLSDGRIMPGKAPIIDRSHVSFSNN